MSPLADFPFEEFMVLLLEFPFLDAPPVAPAADLLMTPFLVVVALLLAMTSSASLPSTRRFLLGGVAVVKDSALLDIWNYENSGNQ